MDSFTDEELLKIINDYKQRKEAQKRRYQKIKDTDAFRIQNRERAKQHYHQNKDKRKQKYEENKEVITARNLYYYYKNSSNGEDKFFEKHPDKVVLLQKEGYFKLQNPEVSICTSPISTSSSSAEPSDEL